MLAAYITARARLNLLEGLEAVEAAGYDPIYSDTDSIYAHKTERHTPELFEKHLAPLLHDSKLGAFKLETFDDVGEEFATGCFVAPKLYALKGPNTGIEVVKARDVVEWLVKNDLKS